MSEQSANVTHFGAELYKQGITTNEVAQRANMWAAGSLDQIYYQGARFGAPLKMFRWKRNPAKDSCEDCVARDGAVNTLAEWEKIGFPKSAGLACHGVQCGCSLEAV